MDRLSRDQEDISPGLFYGAWPFFWREDRHLSEGDVNHLHVGLKGTMKRANFLKDFGRQGAPGLTGGRVEGRQGPGGRQLLYGYDVVKEVRQPTESRCAATGRINKFEACIVRRSFSKVGLRQIAQADRVRSERGSIKAAGRAGYWGLQPRSTANRANAAPVS